MTRTRDVPGRRLGAERATNDRSRSVVRGGVPRLRRRARSLPRPWGRTNQSAALDAAALLDALRRGRVYTVIDAIAGPARLGVLAASARGTTRDGRGRRDRGASHAERRAVARGAGRDDRRS